MTKLILTPDEAKEFMKKENFIEEIVNPRDAFWNIFMDILKVKHTRNPCTKSSINLGMRMTKIPDSISWLIHWLIVVIRTWPKVNTF